MVCNICRDTAAAALFLASRSLGPSWPPSPARAGNSLSDPGRYPPPLSCTWRAVHHPNGHPPEASKPAPPSVVDCQLSTACCPSLHTVAARCCSLPQLIYLREPFHASLPPAAGAFLSRWLRELQDHAILFPLPLKVWQQSVLKTIVRAGVAALCL